MFLRPVIFATALLVAAGALVSAGPARPQPRPARSNLFEGPTRRSRTELAAHGQRLWARGEVIVDFAAGDPDERLDQVEGAQGAEVAEHIDGTDLEVVELPEDVSVTEAVAKFLADPAVESAEPNLLILPTQVIPDDTLFTHLWGLNNTSQNHRIADPPPPEASGKVDADIDAPEAWVDETGDSETVIAVVDTGVAINHPDLNDSLWTNPGEIAGNDIDDDDNNKVDDVHGWDFGLDDASLVDPANIEGSDHGTHVAGTIAAEMNNATGVAGVCPDCKIMVLKFMRPIDTNGDGQKDSMAGFLSDELEALAYARQKDADIINASFSTFFFSMRERRAYIRLHQAGILAVAAAGNSSLDNDLGLVSQEFFAFSPEYPASFDVPSIVSVAASNHDDRYGMFTGCAMDLVDWKCDFTNWGHESVDLAAPGTDIRSTVPSNSYRVFNGTSMAAPHVAGVAGLIESHHPDYGPGKLKHALMNSVDTPNSLKKANVLRGVAVDGEFTQTSGRVNADAALDADPTNLSPPSNGNVDGAVRLRGQHGGTVSWPDDVNDVFYKRLRKGREYKVVLNGSNNDDFDILVWRPGTVEIWQLGAGCDPGARGPCKLLRWGDTPNDADESVKFKANKTQKYYFQVAAWIPNRSSEENSGPYVLKIKRI
jgi:subtilisin family serine protease